MTIEQTVYDAAVAIKNAIDANPLSKKSPSELASEFHVNRNKLLPVFKELTGKTIKRYQLEKIMEAASKMLLSGMTVKEAAIECGYTGYQNNFTRGFKKVFQLGPEEWLRLTRFEKDNGNAN